MLEGADRLLFCCTDMPKYDGYLVMTRALRIYDAVKPSNGMNRCSAGNCGDMASEALGCEPRHHVSFEAAAREDNVPLVLDLDGEALSVW